jgi:uncharacterized protein (DUF427 family)
MVKEFPMPDFNPAPGFVRQPDRRMGYQPAGRRIRVVFNGETVADSENAIALQEEDYPVAYYLPQSDVRMDLAKRTDHSSHCPFKGDASYWSLEASGKRAENAAWSYENPFDEAEVIKGYVAFYRSKVDAIEAD